MIDFTSKVGQRAQERLNTDSEIWLTAVDDQGYPQPNPVWYIVQDDGALLIYSMPKAKRLQHIAVRPQVSLHFNLNAAGEDVVVFKGTAALAPDQPAADALPAYTAKYDGLIKALGYTAQTFAEAYSVPFRVELLTLRGF